MGTTSTGGRRRMVAAVVALLATAGAACSPAGTGTGAPTGSDARPVGTDRPVGTRPPGPPVTRYAGYESETYADPAHWLCRPDADDICDHGLDATVVAADGTLTPEPWKPAAAPPIDCFYVYPTISRDPTPNSDLVPSPTEEGAVALAQVARLASTCRVFAPVYRQVTLSSLRTTIGGGASGADQKLAYGDVLDAWKQYMAHDNQGRGVVLVGHSQGSGLLTQLLRTEIDPNPDVRDHLVAAYLGGTSLRVPEGADVGGDLANVPLCRARDQIGCALAWASFRATAPPPANSYFGRPRAGGGMAACVNPAALAGGRAPLRTYFGRTPGGAGITVGQPAANPAKGWVDPEKGTVTTNFVSTPGLVEGECVARNGFSYLEVTVHGDPADPRADDIGGDLTPEWGLHLIDMNLVMGDMEQLVAEQAKAYTAAR